MSSSGLRPVIGLGRLLGLTFALIAPASSVFLTYSTAYRTAGTGIVLGYAAGAMMNLLVMLSYAEVGSRYPEAGGDYALAARSLGRSAGSVYAVLFFIKGLAIPALLALSTATYARQAWPHLPTGLGAAAALLLWMLLGSRDIRTSSAVVSIMVTVECAVFLLFLVTALSHLHQPASVLIRPQTASGPILSGSWMEAAVAALYGLNGPQASLYYSEESTTRPRQLGRVIWGSALATIGVELSMVIVATLALPTLHLDAGSLPLASLVTRNLSWPWARLLLLIGIVVALFDTGLSTLMSYSRIFFAIARDQQWPPLLNRWAGWISARGVPMGALSLLGLLNLAVLALSGVDMLVMLGGSLIIIIYAGVVAASLKSRWDRSPAPYRLPLWPLPPLMALAGLALLTVHLSHPTLIMTGLAVLLGLAWSLLAPTAG
ncbi:APC family permease [Sulfobacillus harzensis]|uniref:APC family permease n=1 Tax=Sulfobacillus harzensis TaxID=2729629 RepID=A0A7Y0L2N1_9FIRM|nr:APC family permease [Sulfobacillus harzensis]NMP22161.1 APC family permease [Sulfobacillus harzensis]